MTQAEINQVKEIKYYNDLLLKAKNPKRKRDLLKHIHELQKELIIYRAYMKEYKHENR